MDKLELYYRMVGFDDDGATYDGENRKHNKAQRRINRKGEFWKKNNEGAS